MSAETPRRRHDAMASKLALSLVFLALVVLPLVRLFANLDADSIAKVVASSSFGKAVGNSLLSAGLATLITLILAYLLAYCMQRTNIRGKGVFSVILVLPMLIPSISHGMGLILLFGNNGILTNLFGGVSGIYGLTGIVTGSVLYAFPVAFLMLSDVMRYEDASPYEAARVLGIPKWRQFTAISLPYLRKPLISVVFATFTMIVTDYGVPLIVGGKFTTLPVLMYQDVIGQLDFGKGCVYGMVLLLPAVAAFLFDVLNRDKGNASFVTRAFELAQNKLRDALSFSFCTLVSLCTLLPIAAFVILAFAEKYPLDLTVTLDNIAKTVRLGGDRYLLNSFLIALLVSAVGTGVAFATAYLTARMKGRAVKLLHLVAITSMAIPGIVLGLSYVLAFRGSFVYGTLVILLMVNLVHFIASPYLMMYNSLSKINENLEDVGQTLGISRAFMIRDVFLPQCRGTLLEMLSYFFVNCMMTISAVSFLANTNTKPISLMINQFEAQMQLECAAVVSLAILLVNLAVKGIVYLLKKEKKGLPAC